MAGTSSGEDALHAYFADAFPALEGVVGPGNDCAQIQVGQGQFLHWTCDQLVEGIHVEIGTAAEVQARKLLRRTLSDLAAAGAEPWLVSWTVAVPCERPTSWLKALAGAFVEEAGQIGCAVVGGDLSTSPAGNAAVLSCTAIGKSPQPAPGRAGAKAEHCVLVSGRLGGAVTSGRHLLPQPRFQLGSHLCRHYAPSAMMDISDGIAKDLLRILAASGVGADIQLQQIPLHEPLTADVNGWRQAVSEGEDYELLFCLSREHADQALVDPVLGEVGVHLIGTISSIPGLRWLDQGKVLDLQADGWEHGWADDS